MDRSELAQRGYQKIKNSQQVRGYYLESDRFETWLKGDVCTAIDQFWNRPSFQEMAAWPVRHLVQGSMSSQRRLIERVDDALVACAKSLARFASNPAINDMLVIKNPPKMMIVEEVVEITSKGSRRISGSRKGVNVLRLETAQVNHMAKRPWTDLVCRDDYFQPRGGWMNKSGAKRTQAGEFIVSLNPQLHAIGDFVTRCLLRRVEAETQILESFRSKCLAAAAAARRRFPKQVEQVQETWRFLTENVQSLHSDLLMGESARLRDSCIILTHVYLGFQPISNGEWLGIRPEIVASDRHLIRKAIRHLNNVELLDRIAAALGDLRLLNANSNPEESALDEAVGRGGLVLTADRRVFWEASQIDFDWSRHPARWKMFEQLAKKARLGAQVEEHDLYETPQADSTMANLVSRLREALPGTLHKHIAPGTKPKSYRLDISRDKLHFIN